MAIFKPPFGSQIDWARPITRGLCGAWLFNETAGQNVHDYAGINRTSTFSDPKWSNNGLEFDLNNSDHVVMSPNSLLDNLTLSDHTIIWRASFSDIRGMPYAKGNGVYWFGAELSDTSNQIGCAWDDDLSKKVVYSPPITDFTKSYQVCALRRSGYYTAWLDDSPGSPDAISTGFATLNSSPLFIGGNQWGGEYQSFNLEYLYIFDRGLSDREIKSILLAPYQFFKSSNFVKSVTAGTTDATTTGVPQSLALTQPAGAVHIEQDATVAGALQPLNLNQPAGAAHIEINATVEAALLTLAVSLYAGTVDTANVTTIDGALQALRLAQPAGGVYIEQAATVAGALQTLSINQPAGHATTTTLEGLLTATITAARPGVTITAQAPVVTITAVD